jgi:hypothetical protein
MADRHVPVRPNLDQLKHQARDLLRAAQQGDASAIAEIEKHLGRPVNTQTLKLTSVQRALALSYGVASWPRLVLACKMTNAIWQDDLEVVRDLVVKYPRLLQEDARGVKGNWGPPMSYAANLGRARIIAMLRERGAEDIQFAFGRACLQGQLDTARQLYAMGARPERGSVMGPAETQNAAGMRLLLELGAEIVDAQGDKLAPIAMLLETYSRNPAGKHQCLELFAEHGVALPDTPPMAVHRGRIDLLEQHLKLDPRLFRRTFSHQEIYPPELGCHTDQTFALHGTPLAGATLLHLCVDNDQIELAKWMIKRGADVNAPASIDADEFGGHTALFGCVVSQPYRVGLRSDDVFARLLLDHGADLNIRASLRKELRFVDDETMHQYRGVTPLSWGERFHDQDWVSKPVMRLIAESGGRR